MLIYNQYLRKIHRVKVVLIHDKMNKSKVQKIIWLFQENLIIINDNDQSSQYIVNITKLIDVDFTLSRTRRLIQLNFEWMFKNE
jgi:alpha-D-ribose 1-methylphosphonate 5-triphosphate synthase subunit PhnI